MTQKAIQSFTLNENMLEQMVKKILAEILTKILSELTGRSPSSAEPQSEKPKKPRKKAAPKKKKDKPEPPAENLKGPGLAPPADCYAMKEGKPVTKEFCASKCEKSETCEIAAALRGTFVAKEGVTVKVGEMGEATSIKDAKTGEPMKLADKTRKKDPAKFLAAMHKEQGRVGHLAYLGVLKAEGYQYADAIPEEKWKEVYSKVRALPDAKQEPDPWD